MAIIISIFIATWLVFFALVTMIQALVATVYRAVCGWKYKVQYENIFVCLKHGVFQTKHGEMCRWNVYIYYLIYISCLTIYKSSYDIPLKSFYMPAHIEPQYHSHHNIFHWHQECNFRMYMKSLFHIWVLQKMSRFRQKVVGHVEEE